MAGHRRGKLADGGTPPRRRDAAVADFTARVQEAPTAQAQVAVAFDFARWAAKRHPQPEVFLHGLSVYLFESARGAVA